MSVYGRVWGEASAAWIFHTRDSATVLVSSRHVMISSTECVKEVQTTRSDMVRESRDSHSE